MKLIMSVRPDQSLEGVDGYIFAFQGDRLLVTEEEDRCLIPALLFFERQGLKVIRRHYLGILEGGPVYSAEIDSSADIPQGFSLVNLRELFGRIGDDYFQLALHAIQIETWDRMHQYCGKCGEITGYSETDRSKVCPACSSIYYPRISPAVIVAIRRDDKLLLLKNKLHKHDFYSVLAGFVEPGESLEECVIREVREEAGIEVKNIRYFGSQPWPFPNSLMIGFNAEYSSGDLKLCDVEIADAGWFAPEEFPKIPGPLSIARKLIDAFVAENKVRNYL